MDLSNSLNFIVPLIFALAIFAGIAIPAARMRRNLNDRNSRGHSTYSDDTRVRTTHS